MGMHDGDTRIRDTLHDLGNVMARILTTAELIAEDTDDAQTREDAGLIREAAIEGRELIARIGLRLRSVDAPKDEESAHR